MYQAKAGCNYITTGNSGNIAFFVMKFSANWNLLGTDSVTKDGSYIDTAWVGTKRVYGNWSKVVKKM